MELKNFRVKNDKKSGVVGSGIFEYRNLIDFEKVLFLEHNVKELIELLKRKDNHIKDLNEQLSRVIDENEESTKVKGLRHQITLNLETIRKYKNQLKNK